MRRDGRNVLDQERGDGDLPEDTDRRIAAYLSQEENLHRLRCQLFDLTGYRRQSEVDATCAALREETAQGMAALADQHQKELEAMIAAHRQALRKEKEQYEAVLRQKTEAHDAYRASVDAKLRKADEDAAALGGWQTGYGDIANAYASFLSLSPRRQQGIAGIFGGCETPFDFLCGAMQKDHLESLWQYVRDELDTADAGGKDGACLIRLFDFSFGAVNRSRRTPLFQRLSVALGAPFDGDTMGRTAKSPQLGRVKALRFAGYSHELTGQVVCHSLVELE